MLKLSRPCTYTVSNIGHLLNRTNGIARKDLIRLKVLLVYFSCHDLVHFNQKVEAMVTAHLSLDFLVPNSQELIEGIRENKYTEKYVGHIFSCTKLISDSLILECLSSDYYTEQMIRYLQSNTERFRGSKEGVKSLFDSFCNVVPRLPSFFMHGAIEMILSYGLSVEQKKKLVLILSDMKENAGSHWIGFDPISMVESSIHASENNLEFSAKDLLSQYIGCELFVDSSTLPSLEGGFSDPMSVLDKVLEPTKSCLYFDHEYIQQYPYDMDDMDIFVDLLSLVSIHVDVIETTQYEYLDIDIQDQLAHQKKVGSRGVRLSDPTIKVNSATGFYRFSYNGQEYHFPSYDSYEVLSYVAALANDFLRKIGHTQSICMLGDMMEGGVLMIALNLTKFDKLEEHFKIPLKRDNFSG